MYPHNSFAADALAEGRDLIASLTSAAAAAGTSTPFEQQAGQVLGWTQQMDLLS